MHGLNSDATDAYAKPKTRADECALSLIHYEQKNQPLSL